MSAILTGAFLRYVPNQDHKAARVTAEYIQQRPQSTQEKIVFLSIAPRSVDFESALFRGFRQCSWLGLVWGPKLNQTISLLRSGSGEGDPPVTPVLPLPHVRPWVEFAAVIRG